MKKKRRILLGIVAVVVAALHVSLFLAGGKWTTLGKVLLAVDAFSAWFVIGAVREARKQEKEHGTNSHPS